MKRSSDSPVEGSPNPSIENQYLVVALDDNNVKCLVCRITVKRKTYNIKRHYGLKHATEYGNIVGEERRELIVKLKGELAEPKEEDEYSSESCLRASYIVAAKIAQKGRPFTDGDFIKDCMVETAELVCPSESKTFESIPLSARTIQRRVIEMASDMKEQLKTLISCSVQCSLALDESTDVSDTAQLAVFVRMVDSEFNVTEELLDVIPMKDTTTGEDIFNAVELLMEDVKLELRKLSSVATDGAGAMLSEKQGFVGRLLKKLRDAGLPPIEVVHCILHQQQLCAKVFNNFNSVVSVVKTCVNFCHRQGLNHRQFKEFLVEMNAENGDIPFYCETRWLSLAKTLKIFFNIGTEIEMFMGMKDNAQPLLSDEKWIADLAFLTDMAEILSELNVSMQGKNKLIASLYDRIRSFKVEIALYQQELQEGNFEHFPCLQTLDLDPDFDVNDYIEALAQLRGEFDTRFGCFEKMKSDLLVFMTPFSVAVESAPSKLKVELIRLQHNSVLKDRYYHYNGNLIEFYKGVNQQEFPKLHALALKFVSMFGTTYVCEQLFSVMKNTKSKTRSCLNDNTLQSLLRLQASKCLSPDINKLVRERTRKKSVPSLD